MSIRSTRYLKPLLLGCAVLTLIACSGAPERADLPEVPEISDALDVKALPPCRLLTSRQAGELGLGSGQPGRSDLGAQCVWRGDHATVALTRYVNGGGIAALAANSDPATSRVRIEGYPSLETFAEGGDYCRYDVGVSDRQVIVATMEGGKPSSCAALQEVLSYALANLPSR